MLQDATVDYLEWAQANQPRPWKASLLLSGLQTPLSELGVTASEAAEAVRGPSADPGVRAGLARRYGVPEAEMQPVLGTSLGLFLASAALLRPGEPCLVEAPAYEPLRRAPEAVGARLVRFPRRPEAGWALEPEEVLRRWEPGTRLVVVSDLHNPTGREAGDAALAALAREVEARGAHLLVDEVYRDFRPGPVGTARSLGGAVVTVSSLTKVYGLGSLRAGWVTGPEPVLARIRRILKVLQVVDPAPTLPFVLRALDRADSLRERALMRASSSWDRVRDWAGDRPAPRIVPPTGASMPGCGSPTGSPGAAWWTASWPSTGWPRFRGASSGTTAGSGSGSRWTRPSSAPGSTPWPRCSGAEPRPPGPP